MFSVLPPQIFSDSGAALYHRPAVSSPLSSSPIRPSSPPLSPRGPNTLPRRETQSSPLQPKEGSSRFRYAARPARPNPIVQRREDAQDSRRKLFLKNVRQRAEDCRWERRGGDQEACGSSFVEIVDEDANEDALNSFSAWSGGR